MGSNFWFIQWDHLTVSPCWKFVIKHFPHSLGQIPHDLMTSQRHLTYFILSPLGAGLKKESNPLLHTKRIKSLYVPASCYRRRADLEFLLVEAQVDSNAHWQPLSPPLTRIWLQHGGCDDPDVGLDAWDGAGPFSQLWGELRPCFTAVCGLGCGHPLWRCPAPPHPSGNLLLSAADGCCLVFLSIPQLEIFTQIFGVNLSEQIQWLVFFLERTPLAQGDFAPTEEKRDKQMLSPAHYLCFRNEGAQVISLG